MKIFHLVESHTESMGYSDVCLSRALTKLGHDVSVITSLGNSYFNTKQYNVIFKNFLKEKNILGYKKADGYNLHRLKSINTPFGIYLKGLYKFFKNNKPDIVQAGELTTLCTIQAAIYSYFLPYKFIVECHIHKSVFFNSQHLKNKKFKTLRLIKQKIKKIYLYFSVSIIKIFLIKCYPISKDSYKICSNFFLIPKSKLEIKTLGTDTNIFFKLDEKLENLRRQLGFLKKDFICIYTGRMTYDKGPHILLEAINYLNNKNYPIKGLFIGQGSSKYEEQFKKSDNCKLLPYINYKKLNKYYNLSNIGVWPKQESTSQIDALACGLCIIVNDNSGVKERAIDSGLLYKDGSHIDLADKILHIFVSNSKKALSQNAILKVKKFYDWNIIAKEYENDYKSILSNS
jgi:glycosyltransferase involved in cell wall biosynthesis